MIAPPTAVDEGCAQDLLLSALLESAGRGDLSAMSALFDHTAGSALRVAHCVSGDETRARRAVHDAYLEIWHRATSGRIPRGDLGLWVLAVAHRHASDRGVHAVSATGTTAPL